MVQDISSNHCHLERHNEFERFFGLIGDPACIASTEGYFLKVNPAWETTLGYSMDELSGVRFETFIHPDDRETSRKGLTLQRAGTATTNFINRFRHKNGSYRWFEWNTTPAADEKLLFATARDITERRLVEFEREITIAFLSLVNTSKNLTELLTGAAAFFRKQSGCRAIGVRTVEGDRFPFTTLIGPDESFRICRLEDGAVKTCLCGTIASGSHDGTRPRFVGAGSFWTNSVPEPGSTACCPADETDGPIPECCQREGHRSMAIIPLRNRGACIGLLHISDRAAGRFSVELIGAWERIAGHLAIAMAKLSAKEQLHTSRELMQALYDSTPDIIFVIDADNRFITVNRAMAAFAGREAGDFPGKPLDFCFPAHPPLFLEENRQIMASGKMTTVTQQVASHTGDVLTFRTTKGPLYDSSGGITGLFGVARNITGAIRARETFSKYEEQLSSLAVQLCRVEEKERRRIASQLHDHIGQNLAFARMQLGRVDTEQPLPDCRKMLRSVAALLDEAIRQVRTLTFELIPPLLHEVGLGAALEWLGEHFRERHQAQISVSRNDDLQDLCEEARGTLFQAARELLTNVIKHADAKEASVTIVRGTEGLVLSVADRGAGFDADAEKKRPGGNGFGLFNIQQRIMHLGGTVAIRSAPGAGTTVTITVPLPDPETEEGRTDR
ncbi:PAS domain S-box protein [Geobacter sp. SVR]|uniref:PAS domain S-box protein n=1 Tax=Geobacter sp. SVR TaxID=2495594 RepID=UPI00143EF493|nr:PAS domain S-box protein [Geobacter sp. SVR]BCS54832.1 hypothetical protein GSVR_31400 [Geobacter sp. SVR]GCF86360.1 hypothetical protein GSbR_29600 [Geobacter sp. SVR]